MRTRITSAAHVVAMISALLGVGPAAAQDGVYLRITTNYPDAVLYADSIRIGEVQDREVFIERGVSSLRLVPPVGESWTIEPISLDLDTLTSDTTHLTLNFPHYYRIESVPFGASVIHETPYGRVQVGTTPMTHVTDVPLTGALAVERPGYAIERISPDADVWNRYVVQLMPSKEPDPTKAQVHWTPPRKRRAWIDYAAIGTAVAAGIVAVHYKFKADDLYARYEDTADQSLRPEIRSYDVKSGVAFGVMQAGIGIFAIRLALR